ncbi:methyltransferase domain-containing protein [Roseibium sp.]|uniref:methyltransferase domain-containing protein n=1 Tax=Roseibium sp. TaxID=1936156 RepID=UPI003A9726E3
MKDITVNKFRKRRGIKLQKLIYDISRKLSRDINILDIGGRPDFWENIPLRNVNNINILNYHEDELARHTKGNTDIFSFSVGDATNLENFSDNSVDLVHSNSVIEHVGSWSKMAAMANETKRVGNAGWIQTPAWEFPIEPHFRLPLMHWFATPVRRRLIPLCAKYRGATIDELREHAERINLLSQREFQHLYKDCKLEIERFFAFKKSYVITW